MKNQIFLLFLVALFLTSFAQKSDGVDSGKGVSTVVFMRSSFVGSLNKASIYEVSKREIKFIGILKNKKRIDYKTTAGKHTFMVISEAADFMKANLIGGKTYYAIVTPRMGAWKARFSMLPVRRGTAGDFQYESDRFQEFLKGTRFSENTPASNAWYEENRENIATRQAEYWAVWQQKSEADQKERTLNPDDGV